MKYKSKNRTGVLEEVLVGVVGLERPAPILKLPPAPAGVFGRVRQARQAIRALFIEKR